MSAWAELAMARAVAPNLLITGANGTGKSSLTAELLWSAWRISRFSFGLCWVRAAELSGTGVMSKSESFFEARTAPILAVDEVGSVRDGLASRWVFDLIQLLGEIRSGELRPTIWITHRPGSLDTGEALKKAGIAADDPLAAVASDVFSRIGTGFYSPYLSESHR
jgi:hypothetical protein